MQKEDYLGDATMIRSISSSPELHKMHQELMNRLNSLPSRPEFEDEKNQLLSAKIELLQKVISQQEPVQKSGRGGNNVGQNMKKSLLTLIKKTLPSELYQEMHDRLIEPYSLKSQKENIVLFFLYLHILVAEKKIKKRVIQSLMADFHAKVKKYISNSEKRIQIEEERKDFHRKNILEFEKVLRFDLDFSQQKSFAEIGNQVQTLYIRKKMEYQKAEARLKRFIYDHPCLLPIFPDLNDSNHPAKQQGQTSIQQSQASSQNNNQNSSFSSEQIYEQA